MALLDRDGPNLVLNEGNEDRMTNRKSDGEKQSTPSLELNATGMNYDIHIQIQKLL